MGRCTNCGRYPFCYDIINPSIENNCEKWIKRRLNVDEEINQRSEQSTRKENSKSSWWKKNK